MTDLDEIVREIVALPTAAQEEFFERMKETFSEDEVKAARLCVSVTGLFLNIQKYEALKAATLEVLCEKFFGRPPEQQVTRDDPVLVSMYSNSVL